MSKLLTDKQLQTIPNLYETENQKDDGINLRFPTYKMIRDDKDIEDVNIEK